MLWEIALGSDDSWAERLSVGAGTYPGRRAHELREGPIEMRKKLWLGVGAAAAAVVATTGAIGAAGGPTITTIAGATDRVGNTDTAKRTVAVQP